MSQRAPKKLKPGLKNTKKFKNGIAEETNNIRVRKIAGKEKNVI